MNIPQADDLIRYIRAAGESDNIDAKCAMEWDAHEQSAKLARHIAGFANSRDGGVLVIGKKEISQGEFELTGVSDQQAASFDQTKVAAWINSRFSPFINLQCCRQKHDGREYVVILIAEFGDIPVVCKKQFDNPIPKEPPLLQLNVIYARNENAETIPVCTVANLDHFRAILGLTAKKRVDDMRLMFDAVMRGNSPNAPKDDELFAKEYDQLQIDLDPLMPTGWQRGSWMMTFRPESFVEERWNNDQLEELVNKHAVRIRDEFPAYRRGTHGLERGIANSFYGDVWALTRSGIFAYRMEFNENNMSYRCPWRTISGPPRNDDLEPGKWIDFQWSIFPIIEFHMFLARFSTELGAGESIAIELVAEPLAGRRLVTLNPHIHLDNSDPCRAQRYRYHKNITAENFRADWEQSCAGAMKHFVQLFPGHHISIEALRKWVEKFKNRDI